jgi:hypothetical protein
MSAEKTAAAILARIQRLIDHGDEMLSNGQWNYEWHELEIDDGAFAGWRVQCLTFVDSFLGASQYLSHASHALNSGGAASARVREMLGILRALKEDVETGYLTTLREHIHADVFSDFLEMAEHLLSDGYKDPAAMLVGGVLEQHLCQLCRKHHMPIEVDPGNGPRPKKADAMNADLAKQAVYNKLDQKNVTAWLDLRNKAAHGKYDEYSAGHVALILQGVRDFVARYPA